MPEQKNPEVLEIRCVRIAHDGEYAIVTESDFRGRRYVKKYGLAQQRMYLEEFSKNFPAVEEIPAI